MDEDSIWSQTSHIYLFNAFSVEGTDQFWSGRVGTGFIAKLHIG